MKSMNEAFHVLGHRCTFLRFNVERELIDKSRMRDKAYLERIKEYLIDLELWDSKGFRPQELSGGQKQRLAVILCLIKNAKLFILDESTSGLDYKRMEFISNKITETCKEVPIVLITHDLKFLFKTCNTCMLLSGEKYEKIITKGNEGKILNFVKNV